MAKSGAARMFLSLLFVPLKHSKLLSFVMDKVAEAVSKVTPTKLRPAQIRMYSSVPCHKYTKPKHKNDAKNLFKPIFRLGTYINILRKVYRPGSKYFHISEYKCTLPIQRGSLGTVTPSKAARAVLSPYWTTYLMWKYCPIKYPQPHKAQKSNCPTNLKKKLILAVFQK